MIAGSQPVAMADQEFFAIVVERSGFVVYRDLELLFEVPAHPHVMVAGKEMNRDAGVPDLRHFSEDAGIAFRHDCPVLIPEVEEVAYDEDLCRVVADLFEEGDDMPFPGQAGSVV